MNSFRKIELVNLKPKPKRLRKGLIWGLLFNVVMTGLGCKKEEVNSDAAEYYVKYELDSSTSYPAGQLNVVLSAENNQDKNFVIAARSPWELVVGPVEKGFNAKLVVARGEPLDDPSYFKNPLILHSQISVSKNGSPYLLKKTEMSDITRSSAQVNYTIDY